MGAVGLRGPAGYCGSCGSVVGADVSDVFAGGGMACLCYHGGTITSEVPAI